MAARREEVIDIVHNVLLQPTVYGDEFLAKLSNLVIDGYIHLNILMRRVPSLEHYTKEFVCYAIEKEDPPRLELSEGRNMIRIMREEEKVPLQETDCYGRLKLDSPDNQADDKSAPNTVGSSRCDQAKVHDITTPILEGGDAKGPICPPKLELVYYENGKFYRDTLKKVKPPLYDAPEITSASDGPVCWNCEEAGHTLSECEEPRDQERVRKNRDIQMMSRVMSNSARRLCEELALRAKVEKFVPGKISDQLADALNCRDSEPPYYNNMRLRGYPPGYWGRTTDEDPLNGPTQLRRKAAANGGGIEPQRSILVMYDGNQNERIESPKTDPDDDDALLLAASVSARRNVKMVHYPGLDLHDRTKEGDQAIHHARPPMETPIQAPQDGVANTSDKSLQQQYPNTSYPYANPYPYPYLNPYPYPYPYSYHVAPAQYEKAPLNFVDDGGEADMDLSDGE